MPKYEELMTTSALKAQIKTQRKLAKMLDKGLRMEDTVVQLQKKLIKQNIHLINEEVRDLFFEMEQTDPIDND